MADALATLASMFKVNKLEDMKPIQMSIYEAPGHAVISKKKKRKMIILGIRIFYDM